MPANALFKPYSQGNLSLTNRIVMAPMTRQFSPNGVPTSDVAGNWVLQTSCARWHRTNYYRGHHS